MPNHPFRACQSTCHAFRPSRSRTQCLRLAAIYNKMAATAFQDRIASHLIYSPSLALGIRGSVTKLGYSLLNCIRVLCHHGFQCTQSPLAWVTPVHVPISVVFLGLRERRTIDLYRNRRIKRQMNNLMEREPTVDELCDCPAFAVLVA